MVIWSPEAESDVKRIYTYIASDSSFYAKEVVKSIVDKTRYLDKFPLIGRVVPEFDDESIRELIIYSYRIIYEISGSDQNVLAIIHSKKVLK